MKVTFGLMDGQVLQQQSWNQAKVRLVGECSGSGTVEARLLKGGKVLEWADWSKMGRARQGQFEALVTQLPQGGPYVLELRLVLRGKVLDKGSVRNFYVGDVWFLAGQSNMHGRGRLADRPPPHPLIRAFYMTDQWGTAREPLHFLPESVDPVHNGGHSLSVKELAEARRKLDRGVGPGMFFAHQIIATTGAPVGLVCCAHGGTRMEQWSPALRHRGGESLYGAMLRRFRKLGQPIRGILWAQGESDTKEAFAPNYTDNMAELVAAVRQDFGIADLPWLVVQIGRVISPGRLERCWNSVQDQQRLLPDRILNLAVVPSVDLEMDDHIHIAARSHEVLGKRLAMAAQRLAYGDAKQRPPLKLRRIVPVLGPHKANVRRIEVEFDHAVGGLTSTGRPSGFVLTDEMGNPWPHIWRTRLKGPKAILEVMFPKEQLPHLRLAYGLGLDPFCNITDARGMAVPVIGPQPLALATQDWAEALVHDATEVNIDSQLTVLGKPLAE